MAVSAHFRSAGAMEPGKKAKHKQDRRQAKQDLRKEE